ncbi:MAG TPA: flagellar motor protein MotB, partial [Acetobacteraceae bacterium]|nr:flagellar motor protein MotB [Acetobacteraceae bacterium]
MAARGKAGRKGGGALSNQRPAPIIRKEEIVEAPHHGGAWKVAYADFVTAMMAFFLLMWLINATTEAQRRGLADYFSQANVLNRGASGEGKPFGGHTPFDHGSLASDRGAVRVTVGNMPVSPHIPHMPQGRQIRPIHPKDSNTAPGLAAQINPGGQGSSAHPGHGKFSAAANAMRQAIKSDPSLKSLKNQVSIERTPQGLKIQIMDTHKRPMFALGSALPNTMTRELIARITPILTRLGHPVSIAGYTDARPYLTAGHSNWDLSVERANATRQLMSQAGLPSPQISEVSGYGDRDLLLPKTPFASANRRIAILVLARPAVKEDGSPAKTAPTEAPIP